MVLDEFFLMSLQCTFLTHSGVLLETAKWNSELLNTQNENAIEELNNLSPPVILKVEWQCDGHLCSINFANGLHLCTPMSYKFFFGLIFCSYVFQVEFLRFATFFWIFF